MCTAVSTHMPRRALHCGEAPFGTVDRVQLRPADVRRTLQRSLRPIGAAAVSSRCSTARTRSVRAPARTALPSVTRTKSATACGAARPGCDEQHGRAAEAAATTRSARCCNAAAHWYGGVQDTLIRVRFRVRTGTHLALDGPFDLRGEPAEHSAQCSACLANGSIHRESSLSKGHGR